MRDRKAKRIGLAIIGAGRVGLFRGEVAARHPQVDWIGIAEIKPERAKLVAEKVGADFVTSDYRELLKRKEVTAVIISTDEHLHVDPILAAAEQGHSLMIEKPLATDLADSARVMKAIQATGVDAVVGYTQRFRRRWLAAKEKVAIRTVGRRDPGKFARLHEPSGGHRQLQAYRPSGEDFADGDLGYARFGHRDVDDGGQDSGRDLRPLD